jgi:hypothetical protein
MTQKPDGIVDFRGTDYFTVARRVNDFRKTHPIAEGWGLITKLVEVNAEIILFRAVVIDPQGREVATGFAEEKRTNRGINSTSALEVCETSAIGRALAAAGLGGSGAYSSADELAQALNEQGRKPGKPRTEKPQAANTTPQTGKKTPSWSGDRERFAKAMQSRRISFEKIEAFCKREKLKAIHLWRTKEHNQLVADLDAGAFKDLFDPPAQAASQPANG